MAEIKAGDYVTCQKPSYTRADGASFQPLGLSGCKVTRVYTRGHSDETWVDLEWQGFHDPNGPEKFQAPIEWLTLETD
jgi:hypothetical protein